MRRSMMVTVVLMVAALTGCSAATANSPRAGFFPMFADSQCWSASAWRQCKEERKAAGVGEERFVAARHEDSRPPWMPPR